MKILDDYEMADYKEISTISDDVIQGWGREKKYFDLLINNPDFEHSTYLQLINNTQEAQIKLNQTKQSFVAPMQSRPALHGRTDKNHPSTYDDQKKAQLLIQNIKTFMDAYQTLNDYRMQHSTVGRLETQFFIKISELEMSIFNDTQKRIDELTMTVRNDIKTGISNLLNLKSELGLTKEFGDKIEAELKAAKKKEFWFMACFIFTLILIPISVLATNSFTEGMTDVINSYILKGSIAVSLLFVSLFFFSQYRTYMMIRLRYTHLDGFLGGGATFISQLLESDSRDLKLEVNKKLAEMFMNLDDMLKMVHKSKHPTELTLETAESVFDKVSKFRKKD
ncbi:hypothetical protein VoSk93_21290 [Vibrio owensii]